MIAVASMFADHAGAIFDLHDGFRVVGRLAFPLFVYLIAEGCHYTKRMDKYILRLGIFALVSEVPFDLAFNQYVDFFNVTNIFYTLWLGVVCVYVFKLLCGKKYLWILSLVVVVIAMLAADWISSDYGSIGVLFIFLTAVSRNIIKSVQLGVIALFMFLLYFPAWDMLLASLIAVPIVAFASGERGWGAKWLFYAAYPTHLLIFTLYGTMRGY